MDINESVVSGDGSLRITLVAFDPSRGKGLINIEELSADRGWFFISVKFRLGGEIKFDYKTWDANKVSSPGIETINKDDEVVSIEITRNVVA